MMHDSGEEEPTFPRANIIDLALKQGLFQKECWQNEITSIHKKVAENSSDIGNYSGFFDSGVRSHPNRNSNGHHCRMCRFLILN